MKEFLWEEQSVEPEAERAGVGVDVERRPVRS